MCIMVENAEFLNDINQVIISINNNVAPVSSLTSTSVCTNQGLVSGENSVSLNAVATTGPAMTFHAVLWAGTNSISVDLESSLGMTYTGMANVTASLSDDKSVTKTMSTTSGTVQFDNLPARTILFTAVVSFFYVCSLDCACQFFSRVILTLLLG
jgi:hypothetical protein